MIQPILQIRQTPGLISIDADPGTYSIKQPKAEINMHTSPARWNIQQYMPELKVDQSRAFSAYHGGHMLEMNQRIYSGIEQLYLQGIAKRVEQGNRMAEFFKAGNTIAEIYGTDTEPRSFPEFRGPASYDNVDIQFNHRPPTIEYQPAEVDIQVKVRRPEIEYTRGNLDIYMRQYPSVQYFPPELDTRI